MSSSKVGADAAIAIYALSLDRLLAFTTISLGPIRLRVPAIKRTVLVSLYTISVVALAHPLPLRASWVLPCNTLVLYLLVNIAADYMNLTISRSSIDVRGRQRHASGILCRVFLWGGAYLVALLVLYALATVAFIAALPGGEEGFYSDVVWGYLVAVIVIYLAIVSPFFPAGWTDDPAAFFTEHGGAPPFIEAAEFAQMAIVAAGAITWASILVYAGLVSLIWPAFAFLAYLVGRLFTAFAAAHRFLRQHLKVEQDPVKYIHLWSQVLWLLLILASFGIRALLRSMTTI